VSLQLIFGLPTKGPDVRIPKPAPDLRKYWQGEAADAFDKMIRLDRPDVQEAVRQINERYLPWDKIRFYGTPDGLTAEDLWAAVAQSRQSGRQPLPLSFSTSEHKLYYLSPAKHQEWLHHIDKRGGGSLGISANSALGDESERYLVSSLMEEAIASSQLEGASTTRKIAKEMLRANRKPRTKAETMIVNNYRAICEVRELQKEKLTPELLCHLQGVLTENTLDKPDAVGRFRRPDEPIRVVDSSSDEILHVPPAATELEWRIKEICDFANEIANPFVHPAVKASVLHFALGYVHPFVDGNGRTARAIFYWYMLKRDYWLFEYFPISTVLVRAPAKYGRAYLYSEISGGDVTYFIRYSLSSILSAMRGFYDYVAREEEAGREAAKLLESFPGLNFRQRCLVHDALKNPALECTFKSHQTKCHVTNPTARADLQGLVRLGLFQERKEGKARAFRPADNLRKVLHLPASVIAKPEKEKIPKSVAVTAPADKPLEGDNEPTPNQQRDLFD